MKSRGSSWRVIVEQIRSLNKSIAELEKTRRDYARVLEMVRLLFDSGAQVNAAQEGGLTPLHHAAARRQLGVGAGAKPRSRREGVKLGLSVN